MLVDAIVLAGGSLGKITKAQVRSKSLLKIKGKSMLEYQVEALKNSSSVDRIAIVAPFPLREVSWKDMVDEVVVSDRSLTENVLVGLESLNTNKLALVVASDIPLITSEVIDDFLIECKQKEGQVYYPIIPRKRVEERFPECKRTYVKVREGVFTGGNLILADSNVIKNNIDLIEEAYKVRKSPFGLVKILGLGFIIRFLTWRLSIEELEEAISKLIGTKAVAIVTKHPEIGVDVDTDSDLELVQKVLK